MRAQRLELYTLPDYIPRQNKANNYGFNPLEQKTQTLTGMGNDINVHDQRAVESQGTNQERPREHLGSTDKATVNYRSLMMKDNDHVAAADRNSVAPGQRETGSEAPVWG